MMLQVTRYVVLRLLASSGSVEFSTVRRLVLTVMPAAAGIVSNSSPSELREEFDLVASEVAWYCPGARVEEERIEVNPKCQESLKSMLRRAAEMKEHMPALIRMYLDAVDYILPASPAR